MVDTWVCERCGAENDRADTCQECGAEHPHEKPSNNSPDTAEEASGPSPTESSQAAPDRETQPLTCAKCNRSGGDLMGTETEWVLLAKLGEGWSYTGASYTSPARAVTTFTIFFCDDCDKAIGRQVAVTVLVVSGVLAIAGVVTGLVMQVPFFTVVGIGLGVIGLFSGLFSFGTSRSEKTARGRAHGLAINRAGELGESMGIENPYFMSLAEFKENQQG